MPSTGGRPTTTSPEAAFTLIELLVVVALIAVLAAIAVQSYAGYRASAYDARAMHDLGNAAIAQESYYATNFTYVNFAAVGPVTLNVPGMVVSETITLTGEATDDKFTVTAVSSQGTGKTYVYDSETDTIRSN